MATETVLISIPVHELESLIIGCVNSCLKYHEPQLRPVISNPYKNTKAAAEFLGITPNALRVKICQNKGPKNIKKGASLYFLESDLIDYLESGRRKSSEEILSNPEDTLVSPRSHAKSSK